MYDDDAILFAFDLRNSSFDWPSLLWDNTCRKKCKINIQERGIFRGRGNVQ